jgi:glycosyltransferase involved in cell wall biosynthesis
MYLKRPLEASEWSTALRSLLDDKQRRQTMSRRGAERATAFTWDGVAAQLADAAFALAAPHRDRRYHESHAHSRS